MNGNHCTHEDMSNFEGGRKVISIILMIDLMIKTFIFSSKTAVNKYSKVGQWSYPETLLTISLFNVSMFCFFLQQFREFLSNFVEWIVLLFV